MNGPMPPFWQDGSVNQFAGTCGSAALLQARGRRWMAATPLPYDLPVNSNSSMCCADFQNEYINVDV
jgi:hypothetical protein